ncbi:globin family protein [Runella slithyformis]|uniref:Globin n=1 Tax=Runella slithyformis (strain ATCC 29530 / DSM 19594 / LMG 11500 / NCIMB 11436 / LSU 4) TaxID=761193 RepID=A0A7U3ZM91_RUNSL|nr:globin family protein [Runella slithyformis]AEI49816.1 globin [Runella slithyformis DSM 19594]
MDDQQKKLVQTSFARVVPKAEYAAQLFYKRFFELAPEVESLFNSELKTQGIKLFQVISFTVCSLDNMDELLPLLQDLGRQHVKYGAEEHHYGYVGEALLWTLEKVLKEDFTPEIQQAWTDVFRVMSDTMIEAAHQQTA